MSKRIAFFVTLFFISAILTSFYFRITAHTIQHPAEYFLAPIAASTTLIESMRSVKQEPVAPVKREYLIVNDSCGPYYQGVCVVARDGPGTDHAKVAKLRSGMVLQIGTTTVDATGRSWYKVVFDEWLRFPNRVNHDWYVAADLVGTTSLPIENGIPGQGATTTNKRIVVDRTEQMLYAYEGKTLFMKQKISSGLELTPTPRGYFTIFRKSPTRYMQGPVPGVTDQEYDVPGVPWDMFFTEQGGALRGAYWHNNFGEPWSHGCVNLPPDKAKELYDWAPIGTSVFVHD